jgi:general secretion pathway protein A
MYEKFFGLQERPFDLNADPRFLFMTAGHREALTTIRYGISGRKGITMVTGGAGTGKTTLLQAALRMEEGQHVRPMHLANPILSRNEFLEFLALELQLTGHVHGSKTRLLRELEQTLRQRQQDGIVTPLVIDEAQALPDELLEEVRLLANSETSTDKLLPVVLIGQPELATRLNQPSLQHLKQRVALRAALAPLTLHETADYIAERIRIGGGDIRTVFAPEAVAAIFGASGGVPRIVSVICDNALVSGFALDQKPIGASIVAEVCRDFDLAVPSRPAAPGAASPAPVKTPVAAPESATITPLLLNQPTAWQPGQSMLGLRSMESRRDVSPLPPIRPVPPAARWSFRSLFGRMQSR